MKFIFQFIGILLILFSTSSIAEIDTVEILDRMACKDAGFSDDECLASSEERKIEKIKKNSLIKLPDDFDFTYPLEDDQWNDKVFSLDWKISETEFIIHNSANASIPTINMDEYYLDNKIDILQYLYWNEGLLFDVNNWEVHQEFDFGTIDYKTFYKDGYVEISDWEDVNEKSFIKEKRELIFAANAERVSLNRSTVVAVDWLSKPELDAVNNMVHYAFELEWDDGYSSKQGTSLILGRNGYTEVTSMIFESENFDERFHMIKGELSNYNFYLDHKYTDYKAGDKVAAVGIASLLAASFGIKGLAKTGGLLLLLKKFWWIILAPFIFIGRFFNRNN